MRGEVPLGLLPPGMTECADPNCSKDNYGEVESCTKCKLPQFYTDGPDSQNERRHEKSRVLEAGDLEFFDHCSVCGKHMTKAKSHYVCSCKLAIHCSKDCFKSSIHKCSKKLESKPVVYLTDEERSLAVYQDYLPKEVHDTLMVCTRRFEANLDADRSPSSDKKAYLMKITRGDHRRILKYAEAGNAMAAFFIGNAYVSRNFDRKAIFAIPAKYKEDSTVIETNKIAVDWLKKAAEAGIPEAMYCLFIMLNRGLNRRVGAYWLAKAHATGQMEYLRDILESPMGQDFPLEFGGISFEIINSVGHAGIVQGETMTHFLIATRFEQLKKWDGKTAMGEPFYGWNYFCKLVSTIGELKNDQAKPSFIFGEKKTLAIVVTRPGSTQDKFFTRLRREENNLKFRQGIKASGSHDYKLASQTRQFRLNLLLVCQLKKASQNSNVGGRTKHFISCQHDQVFLDREDASKCFNTAGGCESCVEDALQRLRAVSLGQFSISLTLVSPGYYAARYANKEGVIVQDVFKGYSKPYMRQALQCLMTNPADLHPLAIAENSVFFWPIIWFWGSIYGAVQDACDATTLNAIYHGLGDLGEGAKDAMTDNASALAAFPEAAAGEWRIACGNEDCPKVDHEVKFYICKGCKVRRYCDPACQREDWPKHLEVCKAGKKGGKKEKSS